MIRDPREHQAAVNEHLLEEPEAGHEPEGINYDEKRKTHPRGSPICPRPAKVRKWQWAAVSWAPPSLSDFFARTGCCQATLAWVASVSSIHLVECLVFRLPLYTECPGETVRK